MWRERNVSRASTPHMGCVIPGTPCPRAPRDPLQLERDLLGERQRLRPRPFLAAPPVPPGGGRSRLVVVPAPVGAGTRLAPRPRWRLRVRRRVRPRARGRGLGPGRRATVRLRDRLVDGGRALASGRELSALDPLGGGPVLLLEREHRRRRDPRVGRLHRVEGPGFAGLGRYVSAVPRRRAVDSSSMLSSSGCSCRCFSTAVTTSGQEASTFTGIRQRRAAWLISSSVSWLRVAAQRRFWMMPLTASSAMPASRVAATISFRSSNVSVSSPGLAAPPARPLRLRFRRRPRAAGPRRRLSVLLLDDRDQGPQAASPPWSSRSFAGLGLREPRPLDAPQDLLLAVDRGVELRRGLLRGVIRRLRPVRRGVVSPAPPAAPAAADPLVGAPVDRVVLGVDRGPLLLGRHQEDVVQPSTSGPGPTGAPATGRSGMARERPLLPSASARPGRRAAPRTRTRRRSRSSPPSPCSTASPRGRAPPRPRWPC